MMSATPAPTDRARGAVVGVACAGSAIAAHSLGGGDLPTTGSLVVVACLAATVGSAVARSALGLPGLIAQLWFGQFVAHFALGAMSGHEGAATTTMLAGHTATAVIVGTALWFGQRLVALTTSLVRRWLVRPSSLDVRDHRSGAPAHREPIGLRQFLVGDRIPTRGPPAAAAY